VEELPARVSVPLGEGGAGFAGVAVIVQRAGLNRHG
jgi:hypothetical protein